MKIRVRYFAMLREQAGRESEDLPWEDPEPTLERLRAHLAARNPALGATLRRRPILCAVNRECVSWETLLKDGDEVAFFPPVTGG